MNLIYYGVIRIENIPISKKIYYSRIEDIKIIFRFYVDDYKDDPDGTVNNIRKLILKILQKDMRLEKLKKIKKLLFSV